MKFVSHGLCSSLPLSFTTRVADSCPFCSSQVTTMLQHHGKPWRSMCKGLVLGTLLTSFMLLLYSYAVPPLQVSMTE